MIVRDVHQVFFEIAGAPSAGEAEGGSFRKVQPTAGRAQLPSNVRYLALDQGSLRIGWASGYPDMEAPTFGTYTPPSLRAPNGEDLIGVVLEGIEGFLLDRFGKGVTHVFLESVYFDDAQRSNPVTFAKLATVKNFVEYVCLKNRTQIMRCEVVEPAQWRKHFLGYADKRGLQPGVASSLKSEAIMLCGRLGWSVHNEHEAEACGILSWALASNFPDYAIKTAPLFQGRGL